MKKWILESDVLSCRFWVIAASVGVLLLLNTNKGQGDGRPFIKNSDVVFMYAASSEEVYRGFHGTIAGWGGRPRGRDEAQRSGFKTNVDLAHSVGLKYCASVDFLVDFKGFIDFRPDSFMDAVCRDLDGNPLRVPWLWDHKHKGHPAYWFCTNNPDYRAYLRDQAERASLESIDGLHLDDYSGTSHCSSFNGGCFCPHCMKGFDTYLRDRKDDELIRATGFLYEGEFDYGMYLKEKGITATTYKKRHHEVPLIEFFQDYQNIQMTERILEIYKLAEEIRGKPLLRSINSSASNPRTLIPAHLIDYFCGEVNHQAKLKQVSADPLFIYRVVEAFNKRQTATASGHDWAWIKANEKPGLVRTWIAQAYAFGSVFMAPHNQWCYNEELGTHWWHGQPKDFGWVYQFVRENATWLDGSKTLTNTSLIYSRESYSTIRKAASILNENNIPFTLVVRGDRFMPWSNINDSLSSNPHFGSLSGYAHVLFSHDDDRRVIPGNTGSRWETLETLPEATKQQVRVESSSKMRVSLRSISESKAVVCHVLNQQYDFDKDDIVPGDVTVHLSHELLKQAGIAQVPESGLLLCPSTDQQAISLNHTKMDVSFTLKSAGLWSMVVIQ